MALVHHTIPNLWGGVTKQNESARLENQVSEMINCYPTVQSGVTKRPPTVSEIDDIATESTDKIHLISKREDEKYVTEKAYQRPMFVEDIVREITDKLKTDSRFPWFSVEAENFESIHNHSAYAYTEASLEP